MLGAAGAAGLYRRSVKRWYWVLVCVLVELLVHCTTYILKLAGVGCCWSDWVLVLLLGTRLLLAIERSC